MTTKARILAVDDEPANLALLQALLAPEGYEVITAGDGLEGIEKAQRDRPDLILLDVMMPRLDGMEAARRLKQDAKTRDIPIVMVTSLAAVADRVKALEAGADDFLSKPVDKSELRARVKSLVRLKAYHNEVLRYQQELEREVVRQTLDLRRALEQVRGAAIDTILRLSRAAEFKDEDTGNHIRRISDYASLLAKKIGMDEARTETLRYAAPMHDIGKIAIPEAILSKPGKLTDEEWVIMRQHAEQGAQILEYSDSEIIQMAERIARTHHERWDGSGYPRGLRGEDIPIEGRILAVVDVFDALTSRRSYKEPFPADQAFAMIAEQAGKHFDPKLVADFLAIKDEILACRGGAPA